MNKYIYNFTTTVFMSTTKWNLFDLKWKKDLLSVLSSSFGSSIRVMSASGILPTPSTKCSRPPDWFLKKIKTWKNMLDCIKAGFDYTHLGHTWSLTFLLISWHLLNTPPSVKTNNIDNSVQALWYLRTNRQSSIKITP